MGIEFSNKFLTYIQTFYDTAIEDFLNEWIIDNYVDLKLKPINKKSIKLNSIDYLFANIGDKNDTEIEFELIVDATFRLKQMQYDMAIIESNSPHYWIKLSFVGSIDDYFDSLTIKNVELYTEKKDMKSPINGDLLPKIYGVKEYEKFAINYIRKHVDKDYDGSYAIPIIELIKKCGIDLWDYRFEGEHRPLGRIFFVDSEFKCYDRETKKVVVSGVHANTICVDFMHNVLEAENKDKITLAHELAHFMLHRKSFFFQRLIEEDMVGFDEYRSGGMIAKGFDKSIVDRMEIQASLMAPIILMPRKALIEYTKSIYDDYAKKYDDDVVLFIEEIIRDVANHFEVTNYAARRRLKECGFFQKVDAMVWIDGKYIKPFAFTKGSLEYDETFLLTSKQLQQIFDNQKLRKHLRNSKYLFVENHLVVNSAKYLSVDDNGEIILSKYARHHADKCCLKFKLVNETNGDLNPLNADSLFRDAAKALAFNLTIASNENVKSKYNESCHKNFMLNLREAKSQLEKFDNFQDALRYLIEFQDMSQQELANASGLSITTIKRYLRKSGDMSKPSKGAAFRLCIGLQLCEEIAIPFCKLMGVTFNDRDENDKTCLMILQTMSQCTLPQVERVIGNLNKYSILEI